MQPQRITATSRKLYCNRKKVVATFFYCNLRMASNWWAAWPHACEHVTLAASPTSRPYFLHPGRRRCMEVRAICPSSRTRCCSSGITGCQRSSVDCFTAAWTRQGQESPCSGSCTLICWSAEELIPVGQATWDGERRASMEKKRCWFHVKTIVNPQAGISQDCVPDLWAICLGTTSSGHKCILLYKCCFMKLEHWSVATQTDGPDTENAL